MKRLLHLDVATNQTMALEIYGELLSLDGLALDTESARDWLHQQVELYLLASRTGRPELELKGEIIVEIRAVTYANLMYLGVDMPCWFGGWSGSIEYEQLGTLASRTRSRKGDSE
ncbi:MAG: hypothetical protein MUE44_29225 [Oscillatoriaceae cyanobacterium Prado104]|jgi:hypothetical protein|nr:hypothetical protein [Oscillatoriaceae cyanobacterium Prado104]